MRSIALVAILLATSCTRPNPAYCDTTGDCPNGRVCDPETHGCIPAAPDASENDASGGTADAAIDASDVPRCDPNAPFGAPTLAPNVNSPLGVFSVSMSADELTAFVTASDNGSEYLLKMTTRESRTAPFQAPSAASALSAINGASGFESYASTSGDGLLLYFIRTEQFTTQVMAGSRESNVGAFTAGSPVRVDSNPLASAISPQITGNGLSLYWINDVDFKLRSASRSGGAADAFFLGRVESSMPIGTTFALTADELTLYYAANMDIHVSTRATKSQEFAPGAALTPINSAARDAPLIVTSDGCLLWLTSDRAGGLGGPNLWVAKRGP